MKQCVKCGVTKSLEDFQKKSSNKDGRTGNCKACKREYDNAHYKANPDRRDYIRENSKKRIKEAQEFVRAFLTDNHCVDCGESDILVLEFDHREDKFNNVSHFIRYNSIENLKKEMDKCDVRCANCHRRKTARDFGSWRIVPL